MSENLKALNEARDKWWEFGHLDEPLCPHCRHSFNITENEAYYLYDDNESHEVECPSCELSYTVQTHATYHFSTDEQN